MLIEDGVARALVAVGSAGCVNSIYQTFDHAFGSCRLLCFCPVEWELTRATRQTQRLRPPPIGRESFHGTPVTTRGGEVLAQWQTSLSSTSTSGRDGKKGTTSCSPWLLEPPSSATFSAGGQSFARSQAGGRLRPTGRSRSSTALRLAPFLPDWSSRILLYSRIYPRCRRCEVRWGEVR